MTAQMTMPTSYSATPPAALRMVSAELMKIEGIDVVLNDTFRLGVLMLEIGNSQRAGRIICSTGTLSWLDATESKGGREWGIVANGLRAEIRKVGESMATSTMVDLTSRGHKVVDRRKVTRPSDDRIQHLCQGISDLVAQMAAMLAGQVEATPELIGGTARRYAGFAAEMKDIRELLTGVEGMFDLAQMQVVQLMGEEGD